jgi:sulfane dehydrogenase subunit SoxC
VPVAPTESITLEELQLAARNHGMPLEGLRYDVTPIGLHYLLIHYDIPPADPAAWRLEIGGSCSRPRAWTLDELCARPARELAVTMECAGNGRARFTPRPLSQPWLNEAVGTAVWRGAPLGPLLEEAGLSRDTVELVFTGADRGTEGGVEQAYARSLGVEEAAADDVLVAYEMNGVPLPPQHGFPLRLVVPGWYGMTNVKWLRKIEATETPFEGYQQTRGYRFRQADDDEGEPVTRMRPRALMAPPGIPDFFTRSRTLTEAPCTIVGRAWSGWAPIELVDVSIDGGRSWQAAELDPPSASHWAWRGWRYRWSPPGPGEYLLACRARDAAGNAQPLDAPWNVGGYANTSAQRVRVTVP